MAKRLEPPLKRRHSVLPGFGLTLGFTLFYLSLVVLLPLSTLFLKAASLGFSGFVAMVTSSRAQSAYRLSLGASLAAAAINALFGLLLAWVLVRYRFPGRRFIDALVDLPFALPTAVAGIALTTLYAETGWFGRPLAALGLPVAFRPLGIVVALTFIGLPFVVRTLQPVLEDWTPRSKKPRRASVPRVYRSSSAFSSPTSCPPGSRGSPWPSRGPSGSTARWSSSREIFLESPRSRPY